MAGKTENQKEKTIQIFLLRGLTREIRHWGSFPKCLEETAENITVYPLEIPGAGMLRTTQAPRSIAAYPDIIRAQFLQYRKKNAFRIILGISLGGMVAASWLKKYPNDYHGAVFLNTSDISSPFYKRMKPKAFLQLLKSSIIRDIYQKEKIIVSLVCNTSDLQQTTAHWAAIRGTAPVTTGNSIRQLISTLFFRFPEKISVPSLFISSLKDSMVDPCCTEKIAQKLGQTVTVHPKAGHDITTDAPEWCSKKVYHWLAETSLNDS